MQPFEYVMALLSVVVGLGITHVLVALADMVHRARGFGPPIRLSLVHLLWIGYVLTWLIVIWWAEFKFQEIGFVWTFASFVLVLVYFISLVAAAVMLLPIRMEDVADCWAFFLGVRRWFFGALLLATVLDFFDSLLKGAQWALRPEYLLSQSALTIAACVVGTISSNRAVHLMMAATMFIAQFGYTVVSMNVLGRW